MLTTHTICSVGCDYEERALHPRRRAQTRRVVPGAQTGARGRKYVGVRPSQCVPNIKPLRETFC